MLLPDTGAVIIIDFDIGQSFIAAPRGAKCEG